VPKSFVSPESKLWYSTFNISQTLELQTDTAYTVTLTTYADFEAFVGSGNPGNYDVSSFIDPTITLATSDPAYSLAFSPGITATPEPGSLALVATGLAGAGSLLRRKRPHFS
jgi:hypothetical protein